jgi:hypothetical protein
VIYTKIIGIKLLDRVGDESDFVTFDISCVNYIDLYKPTENSGAVPAYHTSEGSYLALSTIRDLSRGYKRFGFKRHGGSTVINEKRVREKIVEENGTTVIFMCGSVVKVRKKHKL